MSLEVQDVEQMVRLFNVEFDVSKKDGGAIFTITDFGVQVVFNMPYFKPDHKNWWIVLIELEDDLEEKRMDTLWQLVRGGYFNYLRVEFPNTFKKMLSQHNYDKLMIKKRLDIFENKPKYKYFKEINTIAEHNSSIFTMSTDPGFFDFLQ